MRRIALMAVVLIAAALVMSAVLLSLGRSGPQTFLFIDTHAHRVGMVLNGTYPAMMIDFPTYSYDPATGELSYIAWNDGITVNGSLVAVLGGGTSIGGDLGSGAATSLVPVYSLPFSHGDVTLSAVDANGTAHLRFSGHDIALAPGESWHNQTTSVECEPGRYCLEVAVNLTVRNYGLLAVTGLRHEG